MKVSASIILWKFVLPVAALVAAVVVFFVVFFDPLAERVVESMASKANGAKVEIDGLKTKFLSGRVVIGRLQVTDSASPMQNVIETGEMAFQLDPSEVARMRFIINEAALHGLQFNTPRKTSGAMPKLAKKEEKQGPPSAAEKLVSKYQGRFQVSLAGMKDEVKQKIDFDPKETALYKRSMELQDSAKGMPDAWKKRIDDLKAQERLNKIQADLDAIKKTPTQGSEALTAIPQSLKKLGEVKTELGKVRDDVRAAKDSATGDVRTFKQGVLSLNEAKQHDVNDLMSRLNLDFADPQRLMESIIGPAVLDRFRTVMKYVEIARKHMPSKKEKESVEVKPRAGGTDIQFPTPAAPPRFWLQKATLDGKYQEIAAQGQMSDLTTDPSRAGRPFKMNLSGDKGEQKYSLQTVLDHVTDVSRDSFAMRATGIDLATVSGAAASLLAGGQASADIAFQLVGEGSLGGGINIGMTGVKIDRKTFFSQLQVPTDANLSTQDKVKVQFAENLAHAIETLPQVTVSAQLFGSWSDPSMKITSNLTDAFTGVVKSTVGNFVKQQRADVEARLDAIQAQEKAKLDAQASALESKVNDQMKGIEAQIDQKVSEASGISLGGGAVPGLKIPKLDKLFKK